MEQVEVASGMVTNIGNIELTRGEAEQLWIKVPVYDPSSCSYLLTSSSCTTSPNSAKSSSILFR